MTKEQAIKRLKKMIKINNGVIKEARKNGYIFATQLTADLNTDSIAIETVLSILEEQDKTIDLMADDIHSTQIECNRYFKDKEDVKQYFKNKAKELLNK